MEVSRKNWICLEVSNANHEAHRSGKFNLVVSIHKKVIKLATRRNRLRRLIREAVRKDLFFADKKRRYHFRVLSEPRGPTLKDVLAAIGELKCKNW